MRLWPYSVLFAACAVVACGSRTGLLVPGDDGPGNPGSPGDDDSGSIVIGGDGGSADDRSVETMRDALPPLDVTVPHDAFNNCPDAGATFVYVVTEEFELMSFYPPTAAFTAIGTLNCPLTGNTAATPFSMAVDQSGIAYVVYSDGELFRVSTATAACQRTAFASGQHAFTPTFGMGFSQDTTDNGETLFVASGGGSGGATPRLASINTTNFGLRIVGNLSPAIDSPELTGTGAGDLFGFYATSGANPCDNITTGTCPDSAIGQIDKTTGRVTNQAVLFGRAQGTAWAFAFWGGDFYTFTAPTDGTIVTRFDPTDGSAVVVAQRSDRIVGAGVSTCAPAE
jgi:hypothetical protein